MAELQIKTRGSWRTIHTSSKKSLLVEDKEIFGKYIKQPLRIIK